MKGFLKLGFVGIVLCLVVTGCRKDKLNTEETELIVGRWEWFETFIYDVSLTTEDITLDVTNTQDSYALEFKKSGRVFFYRNGELVESSRVQFVGEGPRFSEIQGESVMVFSFILLDGAEGEDRLGGSLAISNDVLTTVNKFPFDGNNYETLFDSFFENRFNRSE